MGIEGWAGWGGEAGEEGAGAGEEEGGEMRPILREPELTCTCDRLSHQTS